MNNLPDLFQPNSLRTPPPLLGAGCLRQKFVCYEERSIGGLLAVWNWRVPVKATTPGSLELGDRGREVSA